ncbi:GDSL-type esterase/lipase family protein [Mucilaginibacter sp.]|uniref:GDSL-type esterase/lipase family protein n=1 Tax=Mucilaginibacter sp. TaxID=1882438 RepID=UPI003D0D43AA
MNYKQVFSFITALFIFLLISLRIDAQDKVLKVACIGNSVTYGYGLKNRERECYPAQLQNLLGKGYIVKNFGHSGATLLKKGHNPYYKTPEFADAIGFKPDIAIIDLGLNDTDPRDWPDYHDEFEADYAWLIGAFKQSNPGVKIYICRLTPIFSGHPRFKSGTRDWYWQIQGLIPYISRTNHVSLIDLHQPFYARPDLFADNLHPDQEGAYIMATTIHQAISKNYGGLKLPEVFADNMVLQRNMPVPVSGTANTGNSIEVTFRKYRLTARADEYGHWRIILPAMLPGGPFSMTVKDNDTTIIFKNILIGDVWLCSGQSNMAFPLRSEADGDNEIKTAANNTAIRLYQLNLLKQTDSITWDTSTLAKVNRLKYFSGTWKESNTLSARDFSAIAYYFGEKINREAHVPIGLIQVAVGGSPIESWIDRYTMEHDPVLVDMLTNWRKSDFTMQWCRDRADINLKYSASGKQRHPYEPCYNYEAGIAPLTGFPVKGVLWYQGESNTHNTELYNRLFKAIVTSWRQKWGLDLPFYFVQLSGINRPSWPGFREMENKLQQQIPGVHMAVSMDMGDSLNVHYKQKKVVANRLALLALHYTYKKQITADGPAPLTVLHKGNSIIIVFKEQLTTGNHKPLTGFELINTKGERIAVVAFINKNNIYLKIPEGEDVKAIWYAMQPFTHANLVNNAGIPASTFRLLLNGNEKL